MKLWFFLAMSCLLSNSCSQCVQSPPAQKELQMVIENVKNEEDLNSFIDDNFMLGESYEQVTNKLHDYNFKTYDESNSPEITRTYHVKEIRVNVFTLRKIIIFTNFSDNELKEISGKVGLIGL